MKSALSYPDGYGTVLLVTRKPVQVVSVLRNEEEIENELRNIFKRDMMTSFIGLFPENGKSQWGNTRDGDMGQVFVKLEYLLGGFTLVLEVQDRDGNYIKEERKYQKRMQQALVKEQFCFCWWRRAGDRRLVLQVSFCLWK